MALVSETKSALGTWALYEIKDSGSASTGHETPGSSRQTFLEVKTPQGEGRSFAKRCLHKFLFEPFFNVFFPVGYPASVSEDYMTYQIWNTINDFFFAMSFSIATVSVLGTLGVGNPMITPLKAATWVVLQDLSSRIGVIVFGWIAGKTFDREGKKWGFAGSVVFSLQIFLSLTSPYFPSTTGIYAIWFSAFIAGVVGSIMTSTNSIIVASQAKWNNSADIVAKDESQANFVQIFGLLASLYVAPHLVGNLPVSLLLCAVCSLVHIFACYVKWRCVSLNFFNTTRLLLCLDHYIRKKQIPNYKSINSQESLLFGFGITDLDVCNYQIHIGASIERSLRLNKRKMTKQNLSAVMNKYKKFPFLIIPWIEKKEICIVLNGIVEDEFIIEAYVRSVLLVIEINTRIRAMPIGENDYTIDPLSDQITASWLEFKKIIEASGFNVKQCVLNDFGWRARWRL